MQYRGTTPYESNGVKIGCVVFAQGVRKFLSQKKLKNSRERRPNLHFGARGEIADVITHANFWIGSVVSEFTEPPFSYSP